jgi:iron-sulfur cluster assembly protein
MTKVTKKMMIETIIEKYPKTGEVMREAGLHCIGCVVAASESLEQGGKAHGLSDEQIDDMVKKMNKIIEKE